MTQLCGVIFVSSILRPVLGIDCCVVIPGGKVLHHGFLVTFTLEYEFFSVCILGFLRCILIMLGVKLENFGELVT